LELIGIRQGSTALDFAFAKPQLPLAFEDTKTFGAAVVEEVAQTIRSLRNGNKKKDIDQGVLQSIYALASLVESGRVWSNKVIGPPIKTLRSPSVLPVLSASICVYLRLKHFRRSLEVSHA
jgi:hypothetical protein